MARQRKHLVDIRTVFLATPVALLLWSGITRATATEAPAAGITVTPTSGLSGQSAGTPDILLPEPFAVELPAGVDALAADDRVMTKLLEGAQAGGDRVTALLPRDRVGPGAWRVILSAWDAGVRDRPVTRREAVLMVLPHGTTPVGTTGIGSASIARDGDGFVHMVWNDAWRPGARDGATYRRGRELPDGTVQLETGLVDLGLHRGNWKTSPVVAAAGNTAHFAWQADGTIWYRSLTRTGSDWRWSDEIDTKVASTDQGIAMVADVTAVHILTSDGHYVTSHDAGRTWASEAVRLGVDPQMAAVSLTLDRSGRPLAAVSVLSGDTPQDGGAGSRCVLRVLRRIGAGAWQVQPGPVDERTEWTSVNQPGNDVVCDSFQVSEDQGGAMHAAWQGIASGKADLGRQAWYAWRPSEGDWRPPVDLLQPDPVLGGGAAYVSGMILDGNDALALTTHALHSGWRYRGNDAQLELLRDGIKRASAFSVAGFMRRAMTEKEPAAGLSFATTSAAVPSLFRAADGRLWADVLTLLGPAATKAPGIVAWRHMDVTDWLKAARQ